MKKFLIPAALAAMACTNPLGPTEAPLRAEDPCYGIILEDTLFLETSQPQEDSGNPLETIEIGSWAIDTVVHRVYIQVCN